MTNHPLQQPVETLWEQREQLSSASGGGARETVEAALDAIDAGAVSVAAQQGGSWTGTQAHQKSAAVVSRLCCSVP